MTKLLLVEDDPGIVKSLTEFLQSEGFLVDSASGQGRACRLLEAGYFPGGRKWVFPVQNHQVRVPDSGDFPHRLLR